jgi:hypothetical protein
MLASPLSAAASGMSPGALLQGALHGPGVVGACLTLVREKHFELAAPVFP